MPVYLSVLLSSVLNSGGQVLEKVSDFTELRSMQHIAVPGAFSGTGLVKGGNGLLYGTTSELGAIYRIESGQMAQLGTLGSGFTDPGHSNEFVWGGDGYFYSTSQYGGDSGLGCIYRMDQDGKPNIIISFSGNGMIHKGAHPLSGLIIAKDGMLYGTTSKGGMQNCGTIFRVSRNGNFFQTLVEFTGSSGIYKGGTPSGPLCEGEDGFLYGTTSEGGVSNKGTVFKLSLNGEFTILAEFSDLAGSVIGSNPKAGLTAGPNSMFYGSTYSGGSNNFGTIFRISASGQLTTIYEFNNQRYPTSELVWGPDGNLYGATRGGEYAVGSSVFKMSPEGVMWFYSFPVKNPESPLLLNSDGQFYGTCIRGGAWDLGFCFSFDLNGTFKRLFDFSSGMGNVVGSKPQTKLIEGSDGSLYGTTREGGLHGLGTIYRLTKQETIEFHPTTGSSGMRPAGTLAVDQDFTFFGASTEWPGHVYKWNQGQLQTIFNLSSHGMSGARNLCLTSDGNLIGTAYSDFSGGPAHHPGFVYKINKEGAILFKTAFDDLTGKWPESGVIRCSDGNYYGTTRSGGAFNLGSIYSVSESGEITNLVSFTGNTGPYKGATPGPVMQASNGRLYGMTGIVPGGGVVEFGTIYEFNINNRSFETLVVLSNNGAMNKGRVGNQIPVGLIEGRDDNLYGVTPMGGKNDFGTVFCVTKTGQLTTLSEFSDSLFSYPRAPLLQTSDGNFYGSVSNDQGDAATGRGDGGIFRLILTGKPMLVGLSPTIKPQQVGFTLKLNPRGHLTDVQIEYGLTPTNLNNSMTIAYAQNGYVTRFVGTNLTTLNPGTTYYYRLRASSGAGITTTDTKFFTTLSAPFVQSLPASEAARTSVRMNAVVNARNYSTGVRFEWGTDGNAFPNSLNATPAMVVGDGDVFVSAPVAGLSNGVTYFYRVVATNEGGTMVSGTQSFRTLTDPSAVTGGHFALSTTSVRVDGTVNARGASSSVVFEYGTDGVNFPNSIAGSPGVVTGETTTPVSAVLSNLSQGVTYHYRLKAMSAGGVSTSDSATFSMTVLSGFNQNFPPAPPEAQGFLIVNLTPNGVLHGWRFMGEKQWRSSGVPAGGLVTGDREIEFRTVPGYIQPPNEIVGIISGEAATVVTRDYYDSATSGSGGLMVSFKPDSITAGPSRAQWRFIGEGDGLWRDSGVTAGNLLAGSYLIECKPVPGRATPPNATVLVSAGETKAATITYFLSDPATGALPGVLAYESVTEDSAKPYAYVGQIRSNAGSSSGFVVKPRVVATAGHVVWDDGTLSIAQGLQWLFQRHRGLLEPKPLLPRGFYLFDGYAAQRMLDNSPGDSSPQSQQLDVAALYFNENAGRGGYGGFLASDLAQNEFLLSNANKMLVGYPVDGISSTSQGRMHATVPFNVGFNAAFGRTFITSGIRSSGGNSGGPLCVQFEGGAYYPAAIYLGGDNQTVVRAIDSDVVDLFNRAEVSSNGGSNNTGGGITHTSISLIPSSSAGSIKVFIEPAGARAAGAGWKLSLRKPTPWRSSSTAEFGEEAGLSAGDYILKMITVSGYDTPADAVVTVTSGTLTSYTYTYNTLQESWRAIYFGTKENTGSGADTFDYDGDGFTNAAEYAAGTNPTLASDRLRTNNPQRGVNSFSVTTDGRSGRIYYLERSFNLGNWTTVATQGPLSYDTTLTLTDASAPSTSGFYRIRVTGPGN